MYHNHNCTADGLPCARPEHKSFCKQVDPNGQHKDGLSRLWPLLEANSLLNTLLLRYIQSVADLEQDARRHMTHKFAFAFSLHEDPVRRPGDTAPRYMLQLQQVFVAAIPLRAGLKPMVEGEVRVYMEFNADGSMHGSTQPHTAWRVVPMRDIGRIPLLAQPVAALV